AILFWQKRISDAIDYGTVLFVFGVFVVVPGAYFLIRRIFGKVREKCDISSHTKFLWEIFIVLSLFCVGLLYRFVLYFQNIEHLTESSYYRLATVKADAAWEPMVHGISYLYTMCLSFALSFLGNKVMAAVWLQILLQMITVLLAFFTVRRLVGRIPACITMLVMAISSVYAGQILTMTPESLFFVLYLTGMFIVGSYVKNNCGSRRKNFSAVPGALMAGFIIGVLTYLDVISLTLVVLLAGLVTGEHRKKTGEESDNKEKKRGNAVLSVLLIFVSIAGGGLTFLGMLALNAYSYYEEIAAMAETLAVFYRTHFQTDYVFYQTEYSVVECFMIVILAVLLIMAFWNRRKVQNVSPWIVLMLLLAPTPLTARGVLPYQACSIFIWSVLAGLGVQQSLVWERPAPVKEHRAEAAQDVLGEAIQPAPEERLQPVPDETPQPEKPRFLENPLPLPKKHEKRTMDYQYEVAEDQMKFDFEVNVNDDFDIE
ncbi:MAG: hypothetical protein K2H40_01365, partial [Lachnospiraceae bacterium]|nr:hypothetical protein [Lachnospiraceae bacterium]